MHNTLPSFLVLSMCLHLCERYLLVQGQMYLNKEAFDCINSSSCWNEDTIITAYRKHILNTLKEKQHQHKLLYKDNSCETIQHIYKRFTIKKKK